MTDTPPIRSASALSAANRAALAHVRARAARTRRRDLARIRRVLREAGIAADPDALCAGLRRVASVTVNFHPDRVASDGRPVAVALATDGVYRSQFETRISNGGLTAYPGGERDRWEARLFGGAYQARGVTSAERPRYAGLDLLGFANGACPRFGSCHLRLAPSALERATFFVGDSVLLPEDGGVLERLEPVLAGLLERIARGDELGRPLTVAALVGRLLDSGDGAFAVPVMSHALDGYIEAQIHGPIALETDVEAVVLDPSFRGTAPGDALLAAARRHGLRVGWHAGSRLTADAIPTTVPPAPEPRRWRDFCAAGRAARLAGMVIERFAADGTHLDAAAIGRAAVSVVREPAAWQPWEDAEDPLTRLKDLWHLLVIYGRPAAEEAG